MSQSTEKLRHTIETPEGVSFSLELAGPLARLLAWAIDFGCKAVLLMTLGTVLSTFNVFSGDFANSALILMGFLVTQGYQIALEYFWRGQTIGKRIMRLRVMDEQGLQMRFSQVALRNLLRVADQLPSLYLVGGIAMLLSPRAQRLGDFAANTIVVRTRASQPYETSGLGEAKYNSFRAWPHLEARLRQRVDPEAVVLASQALARRNTLEPAARLALLREFADYFRTLADFPESASTAITDEQYVRNALDSLLRTK